jgi:hypothetical protein
MDRVSDHPGSTERRARLAARQTPLVLSRALKREPNAPSYGKQPRRPREACWVAKSPTDHCIVKRWLRFVPGIPSWVRLQPEFVANVAILLGIERAPVLGKQAQRGIARFREIRADAAGACARPQFQQTTSEHAGDRGGYLGLARLRPSAPGSQPDAVSQAGGLAKAGEELEPQQGTLRGVKG